MELRNKMMLGALTMGDLHSIVRGTGILWRDRYREFSVGGNWLPVGAVRKRASSLNIWMEDIGKVSDLSVPVDSVVKVRGNVVELALDSEHINVYTNLDRVELRIRLDFEPFPETNRP